MIASIAIGLFILPRAWSLLREVVDVLLEATPKGIDLDQVRQHICGVGGVVDVHDLHDLHVWTITSGVPALSAHVVDDDGCIDRGLSGEVLDALAECLGAHFDTDHCTFQLEPIGHGVREAGQHACCVQWKWPPEKGPDLRIRCAPASGLEPLTVRLTVGCSAN